MFTIKGIPKKRQKKDIPPPPCVEGTILDLDYWTETSKLYIDHLTVSYGTRTPHRRALVQTRDLFNNFDILFSKEDQIELVQKWLSGKDGEGASFGREYYGPPAPVEVDSDEEYNQMSGLGDSRKRKRTLKGIPRLPFRSIVAGHGGAGLLGRVITHKLWMVDSEVDAPEGSESGRGMDSDREDDEGQGAAALTAENLKRVDSANAGDGKGGDDLTVENLERVDAANAGDGQGQGESC